MMGMGVLLNIRRAPHFADRLSGMWSGIATANTLCPIWYGSRAVAVSVTNDMRSMWLVFLFCVVSAGCVRAGEICMLVTSKSLTL